jgi:DNA polymerase-4
MAILADFTPFIEPGGLDEAYLDVTGFESLHGSIREMALSMKRRIKNETGLNASVGISSCKVVSKVASDYSKPDGLIEVKKGDERSFLAPLPVSRLPGVGRQTEKFLKSTGIETVGELAALSPDILKKRLGVWGENLHRLASGMDDRKVEPPGTTRSISRETTFSRDIRDRSVLKATLRYLSERVGADLRSRIRQARCVTIKLRYADFTTLTRSKTFTQTIDSDNEIYGTGEKLLEKALAEEKQAVRLIGIGVSNLSEMAGQLSMMETSSQRQTQLDRAIDRIRMRYGFTAIQTGRTLLLKDLYPQTEKGYKLHTPGLSR